MIRTYSCTVHYVYKSAPTQKVYIPLRTFAKNIAEAKKNARIWFDEKWNQDNGATILRITAIEE